MRPTSSADMKTKPSAEERKPMGWFTKSLKRVGRCVSVIQTRNSPRSASSSGRRSSLGRCRDMEEATGYLDAQPALAGAGRSLLIRRNSGHALPQDQGVDVVRSLVGLDRFQVHHVAHDRVVVCDAVATQNVAGQP